MPDPETLPPPATSPAPAAGVIVRSKPARDPTVSVAWIALLQKMIWPTIALVALLLFFRPIAVAIDRASSGSGATVEIGTFKITLPKGDLPPPPSAIKALLPKLDADLIEKSISNVGDNNRVDTCYHVAKPDEMEPSSVKMRLKNMGLIDFEPEATSEGGKPCEAGSLTTYNPLYNQVRSYLIEILRSLKFTN